jgi:hypothetical protein
VLKPIDVLRSNRCYVRPRGRLARGRDGCDAVSSKV